MDLGELIRRTVTHEGTDVDDMDTDIVPTTGGKHSLSYLRVHFEREAGSGDALDTLRINIVQRETSRRRSDYFNFQLYQIPNVGVESVYDVNFRVPDEQLRHFLIDGSQAFNLTWTSGDGSNIRWAYEMGLIAW